MFVFVVPYGKAKAAARKVVWYIAMALAILKTADVCNLHASFPADTQSDYNVPTISIECSNCTSRFCTKSLFDRTAVVS